MSMRNEKVFASNGWSLIFDWMAETGQVANQEQQTI